VYRSVCHCHTDCLYTYELSLSHIKSYSMLIKIYMLVWCVTTILGIEFLFVQKQIHGTNNWWGNQQPSTAPVVWVWLPASVAHQQVVVGCITAHKNSVLFFSFFLTFFLFHSNARPSQQHYYFHQWPKDINILRTIIMHYTACIGGGWRGWARKRGRKAAMEGMMRSRASISIGIF
jgi:hypothetical protein